MTYSAKVELVLFVINTKGIIFRLIKWHRQLEESGYSLSIIKVTQEKDETLFKTSTSNNYLRVVKTTVFLNFGSEK